MGPQGGVRQAPALSLGSARSEKEPPPSLPETVRKGRGRGKSPQGAIPSEKTVRSHENESVEKTGLSQGGSAPFRLKK